MYIYMRIVDLIREAGRCHEANSIKTIFLLPHIIRYVEGGIF